MITEEMKQGMIERHKYVAAVAGHPGFDGVLHEHYLEQYDGICGGEKRLLPKGWWINDYSPTENLIEIEDTTKGDRFWIDPVHLFHRPFKIDQRYVLVKNGAKRTDDPKFQDLVYLKKFDAKIFRKRCYIYAIFYPIPAGAEVATS